jgi:hypothetical protein
VSDPAPQARTTRPAPDSGRIRTRFAALKQAGRGGLVTFLTAGDPDRATSMRILEGLPAAGADVIELGMPFTDPMADGPAIQASSQRALKAGIKLREILEMVAAFRAGDAETPIILMGYYNPIYNYGVDRFLADAKAAGVDGLIVVDLPPEEDQEPASTSSAWRRRPPTTCACQRCWRIPAASYITYRSWALPAPVPPPARRCARRSSGSSGTPTCRSP